MCILQNSLKHFEVKVLHGTEHFDCIVHKIAVSNNYVQHSMILATFVCYFCIHQIVPMYRILLCDIILLVALVIAAINISVSKISGDVIVPAVAVQPCSVMAN